MGVFEILILAGPALFLLMLSNLRQDTMVIPYRKLWIDFMILSLLFLPGLTSTLMAEQITIWGRKSSKSDHSFAI